MGGDDRFGLNGVDWSVVGVADEVGPAAVHHRPEAFGQVGGDHAEGAEVVLAALDHLDVVDPGELGVLVAGVVGGADQGGAQQARTGFRHRLALAVGVAGLGGFGGQTGEAAERLAGGEPGGVTDRGDQGGAADVGDAGQAACQPGRVDLPVAGFAVLGMTDELGLHGAQQPDLGGDLSGQIGERRCGVAGVEGQRGVGGVDPLLGPVLPWWLCEACR